ncbi:MAG: hisD, partial [Marmoricola sp.]|nr:hisD [Marmoricola sp.]
MSKQLKAAPGVSLDASEQEGVRDVVRTVIDEVRREGDTAVRKYSAQFDNWSPDSFLLGRDQAEEIVAALPQQVVSDILEVQANVRHFAQLQLESMHSFESEVSPGVFLGQKHLPIRATGAYVPGGRYALTASAHMTVVTAKVAGVERVTACTPPIRGELPVATIAALHLAGADEILMLGGVQAVAALALGTETIGRVDLLAGPGNAYVAEAKRQLFGEVGIDL